MTTLTVQNLETDQKATITFESRESAAAFVLFMNMDYDSSKFDIREEEE